MIAELVLGVAAMLGMRNRRQARACDTNPMPEALPQATRDTQNQEADSSNESFSGLSRESLLEHPQGLADIPRAAINRDARHKAEHDTVGVAYTLVPQSPRASQARASSFDRLTMRRSRKHCPQKGLMVSLLTLRSRRQAASRRANHEAVLTALNVSPSAPA
ncbi:MAG: hypothetical protein B7Y90_10540 [Alphaproteobacteria bacterium 32-64-14]|nr:MAG: hypothetical protein B7Y90_10540 [Alphaproteobacteria bacterium 32-64-14]